MKIAVYEHICGGGYYGKPLPATVLAEGYGMLKSISADFKAAGHEVTVFLDERIANLNPPLKADTIITVNTQASEVLLPKTAQTVDAFMVIAPETANTLQTLVKLVESTGKISLNCTSDAVASVSDKSVLYVQLQINGISVPKTTVLQKTESLEIIKQTVEKCFLYPVVFKPIDGTSCGGISLVRSKADIEKALNKVKTESASNNFILQEYVAGEPASVSLICNGKKAKAVSLNKQTVNLNAPYLDSCYQGGCVPLNHRLKEAAFSVAERTVELFLGLRGHICVDVILGENTVYVLDLNPRLTTSYVGLREVSSQNFGQAIIDAATEGKLPEIQPFRGFCCFGKTTIIKPTVEAYQKTLKAQSTVSPLFPITDPAVTLLRTHAASAEESIRRLEEAKKTLHNSMC